MGLGAAWASVSTGVVEHRHHRQSVAIVVEEPTSPQRARHGGFPPKDPFAAVMECRSHHAVYLFQELLWSLGTWCLAQGAPLDLRGTASSSAHSQPRADGGGEGRNQQNPGTGQILAQVAAVVVAGRRGVLRGGRVI